MLTPPKADTAPLKSVHFARWVDIFVPSLQNKRYKRPWMIMGYRIHKVWHKPVQADRKAANGYYPTVHGGTIRIAHLLV